MAPVSLSLVAIAVVFSAIPGGWAGAACTNKEWSSVDQCIKKCSSRFGWGGHVMGSDPWGLVVKPSKGKEEYRAAVKAACLANFGAASASSSIATSIAAPATVVNAGSAPPVTETSTTSLDDLETSSVAKTSSSSAVPTRISTIRSSSSILSSSVSSVTRSRALIQISPTTFSRATVNNAFAATSTETTSTFVPPPPPKTTSTEPKTTSPPPPPPPPKTTKEPEPTPTPPPPPPPKTTTKQPAQTAAPGGGGNGGGGGGVNSADQQRYLDAHNTVRGDHDASPLRWADDLEAAAQKWANKCVFEHSGGVLGPFGENLAAGTGNGYTIESAVKSWTDEVSDFRSGNPKPSHFTQVVWRASSEVGCAVAECDGIFDSSFGKAHYHVCEYRSQGNVIGQFADNVHA